MTTTDSATALGFEHVHEAGTSGWTLLLLHGTGGDEHQLLDVGRQLAPGASLLSPRGKVLEGGVTPRFFARHNLTDLDLDDLRVRTDELAEFVHDAAAAYDLDPGRIVAVGYSNGASIAVNLLFQRPESLRAAVLLRPVLPYEPETPLAHSGTSVLVVSGARDPYVPLARAERLVEVLREGGAEVAFTTSPGGHELGRGELADAARWLGPVVARSGP
jgi:phospholipase/carboxylesterase/glyoxalase family protein